MVHAEAAIQTRRIGALVDVDLALGARKSRHADATEGAGIVQAAAVVVARMRLALIHVRLAARPREALRTVAGKRARRVHANAVVLARRSLFALVNVLGAVDALVAGRTGAGERAVDRARVANGVRVARIRRTGIVQMAQQSSLPGRAQAHEAAHAVDAGRPVEARRTVTVVYIDAAVRPRPAVDTDARIAADRIRTGGSVLAHRGAIVRVGRVGEGLQKGRMELVSDMFGKAYRKN